MLRVHGIANLRIADNSVMPNITTGHTLAPTLVIAEQAASMIATASRADEPASESLESA
jgi:choline dehydrogenase-like flavoprotein